MQKVNNDTYTTGLSSNGFFSKIIYKERLKMYSIFKTHFEINENTSCLDVGASSDEKYVFSNYFEELYPYKNKITAIGIHDASFLETRYEGLKYIKGDGRSLPFENGSFDIVFSNAVIEHVGNFNHQKEFLKEAFRVCKKGVFLTTPNRIHPIEFHTMLPFIHYLPKKLHRKILKLFQYKELSAEENLNLILKRDFIKIAKEINIENYEFYDNYFLFFPSNIIFIANKN